MSEKEGARERDSVRTERKKEGRTRISEKERRTENKQLVYLTKMAATSGTFREGMIRPTTITTTNVSKYSQQYAYVLTYVNYGLNNIFQNCSCIQQVKKRKNNSISVKFINPSSFVHGVFVLNRSLSIVYSGLRECNRLTSETTQTSATVRTLATETVFYFSEFY